MVFGIGSFSLTTVELGQVLHVISSKVSVVWLQHSVHSVYCAGVEQNEYVWNKDKIVMQTQMTTVKWYHYRSLGERISDIIPGLSEKKYGVVDYQYFGNGETQQCDICRHCKYNFCLVVCEISTPHVKGNASYEVEKNSGSNRT